MYTYTLTLARILCSLSIISDNEITKFVAWSESIDGGKKPVGAECINRLRNVSRLIGGDLVTFLNGDNIKEKWLETSYAPMKAKSRQKAILTVRRFVEYVIDRYSSIQCGSDNMPSPDDLVQLKNRLEKWQASYNKDKQKQDSLKSI